MTTTAPFQLGSISTGTVKPEDLVFSFANILAERQPNGKYDRLITSALLTAKSRPGFGFVLNNNAILSRLTNALNQLCPPFVYFGAHCQHKNRICSCPPGDRADFGFWPDWPAIHENMRPDTEDGNNEYFLWKDEVIFKFDGPACLTVMDLDRNFLWSTV